MVAAFFLQAKSYPEASSQEGYGEGGGWGAKGSVEMQVTGKTTRSLRLVLQCGEGKECVARGGI